MPFSNYLSQELLDHVFGSATRNFTSPANVFVGLSSTEPDVDGTGITEPSAGAYARKSTAVADWNVASVGGGSPVAVSSIVRSGTEDVALVTTSAAHGLLPGMRVAIAGATQTEYNGRHVVGRVPSTTTFEYIVTGDPVSPATGSPTWEHIEHGFIDNGNAVTFAKATADWLAGANLGWFVLFDALSAGNFLAFGTVRTPKAVLLDDTAEFAAGDLEVLLD